MYTGPPVWFLFVIWSALAYKLPESRLSSQHSGKSGWPQWALTLKISSSFHAMFVGLNYEVNVFSLYFRISNPSLLYTEVSMHHYQLCFSLQLVKGHQCFAHLSGIAVLWQVELPELRAVSLLEKRKVGQQIVNSTLLPYISWFLNSGTKQCWVAATGPVTI